LCAAVLEEILKAIELVQVQLEIEVFVREDDLVKGKPNLKYSITLTATFFEPKSLIK